jgi:group I intron endonuclease
MLNFIYLIENKISGRFYVGRTNNPAARKRSHFSELQRGVHGNPKLQNSFNKHGKEAFEFSVVDSAEESLICEKEATWFSYFEHSTEYLYNCHFETIGGPRISTLHTVQSKQRISESLKNNTRKYIFSVLDEGYETRVGVNKLAKKYKIGSTTLLRYKSEWEELTGLKYDHPQSLATKEKLELFFKDWRIGGEEVYRRMAEYGVARRSLEKYAKEFGIDIKDLKCDSWKSDAKTKAISAFNYKIENNCSTLKALKATGATVTTFYKYLPEMIANNGKLKLIL